MLPFHMGYSTDITEGGCLMSVAELLHSEAARAQMAALRDIARMTSKPGLDKAPSNRRAVAGRRDILRRHGLPCPSATGCACARLTFFIPAEALQASGSVVHQPPLQPTVYSSLSLPPPPLPHFPPSLFLLVPSSPLTHLHPFTSLPLSSLLTPLLSSSLSLTLGHSPGMRLRPASPSLVILSCSASQAVENLLDEVSSLPGILTNWCLAAAAFLRLMELAKGTGGSPPLPCPFAADLCPAGVTGQPLQPHGREGSRKGQVGFELRRLALVAITNLASGGDVAEQLEGAGVRQLLLDLTSRGSSCFADVTLRQQAAVALEALA